MSSLLFILLCCLGGLIINLWFYSDFFAYYVKLFKFVIPSKLYTNLLVEEYLNNQNPDIQTSSYIEYLYIKKYFFANFYGKFFLKLLSCIICFTTWVAIIISLILGNILFVGLVFLILRLIDFILRYTLKKII
jgi:hypothetical protein